MSKKGKAARERENSNRKTMQASDQVYLNGVRDKYSGVLFTQGKDGFSISLGELTAVFIWGVFDEPDWPTRINTAVKWLKDKAQINAAEAARKAEAENGYSI